MKSCVLISSVVLIALALYCTNNLSGTTDETSSGVVAMLYNPDGSPAKGALIKVFPINENSTDTAFITLTDDDGRYSLEGIKTGQYNVFANRDTLVAFQDSVVFAATTSTLKSDTLESGGSFTGIVGVQPNHDPRTVTVQIIGSDITNNNVGVNGFFTIENLAQGDYRIKLTTTQPEYTPTFYTIKVSGTIPDTLKDTLWLIYTGIPVVTGLTAQYDTLHGVVTLKWNTTKYHFFQDYALYKEPFDSNTINLTPFAYTQDTLYYDTIFKKSLVNGQFSFNDPNAYRYKYRATVRSNSNIIGAMNKYWAVTAASPLNVKTTFSHINTHIKKGYIIDTASINDSIQFIYSFSNKTRALKKILWSVNSINSVVRIKALDSTLLSNIDTLYYSWPSIGNNKIYVSVEDVGGAIWIDSSGFLIVKNNPIVVIGKDDTLSLNDTIRISGTVSDYFGTIAAMEWSVGGGAFTPVTPVLSIDTFFIAPAIEDLNHLCILKVIDDDGNVVFDTVKTRVETDPPITKITGLPNYYIPKDSSFVLKSSSSLPGKLGVGKLVKYEWSIGDYNKFKETSAKDTTIMTGPEGVDSFVIVLRVTDEDGLQDLDTGFTNTHTVIDIDGNRYHTVTIGTQTWLVENLKTTRLNYGAGIPLVNNTAWIATSDPGYCWYNFDSTMFKETFGALYNWYAVNTGKLAPTGWHVPTTAEWDTLINYLGGISVAGGKLKEAGLAHWRPPNTGATNETGFSAIPGGYRTYDSGAFGDCYNFGNWWSSTETNGLDAIYLMLSATDAKVKRTSARKKTGFSVRCIKD